jgi:hypothetical protein
MVPRLLVAFSVVSLLAGCAGPAPTPKPVADPVPVAHAFDCDAVMDATLQAQAMRVPESTITAAPQQVTFDSAGLASSGLLQCRWDAPPTESENPPTVILSVLPDAAADYAAFTAARQHLGGVSDSLSAGSNVWCSTEFEWASCTLDFESRGYWVSAIIDSVVEGRSPAMAEVDATAVGTAIIARLADVAPPVEVEVEGAGESVQTWGSCEQVSHVFDGYVLTSSGEPAGGEALNQFALANHRSTISHCAWTGTELIPESATIGFAKLSIIERGATSWPELEDAYREDPAGTLGWDIDVEGADSAVVLCHQGVDCAVIASAGGSVLRAELAMTLSITRESSYDEETLTNACVRALERAIAELSAA